MCVWVGWGGERGRCGSEPIGCSMCRRCEDMAWKIADVN
jgi:hypothetical protein